MKYKKWYATYDLTAKEMNRAYKIYRYMQLLLELIALICIFTSHFTMALCLIAYLLKDYFHDCFKEIYILKDKEENE